MRRRRKIPFSTQLPPELVEQVRAAVLELQRDDPSLTIAQFTERALAKSLVDAGFQVTDSVGITQGPRPGRRISRT